MHKWKPGDRFRIRADWKHGGYPEDNGRKPREHGTVIAVRCNGVYTDLAITGRSPGMMRYQWYANFEEIEPVESYRELHEDEGG